MDKMHKPRERTTTRCAKQELMITSWTVLLANLITLNRLDWPIVEQSNRGSMLLMNEKYRSSQVPLVPFPSFGHLIYTVPYFV